MNENTTSLPPGFEDLEPYVDKWAVSPASEREKSRVNCTESERNAFYEAVSGVLQDGLAYLDRKDPQTFNVQERSLMNIFLSFVHVALAVEIQKREEPSQAERLRRYTRISRASADR